MSNKFTTIEATYRITTPMFCSGADKTKAELRLPSFKGALRFWWRSLMNGKVRNVAELRDREAALFGSSDQRVGQSKVRMRLAGVRLDRATRDAKWSKEKGIQYLGYGVVNYKGELSRLMIPSGVFTVQLRLEPNLSDEQQQEVQNALILLGTVGGLGSKSRKGFGSLTLTGLKKDEQVINLPSSPGDRIKMAVGTPAINLPEWTAWSSLSRILCVTDNQTDTAAVKLLDSLGKEQVYFRSWGKYEKVLGQSSEKNFKEDHNLSKGTRTSIKHPKRIVFGLPHNYGQGRNNAVEPAGRDLTRRASPLFLHVHQTNERSKPIGVVAFLPALFLPEHEEITAFGNQVSLNRNDDFWDPIHGYIDRLLGKRGATQKKTTIQAEEVSFD